MCMKTRIKNEAKMHKCRCRFANIFSIFTAKKDCEVALFASRISSQRPTYQPRKGFSIIRAASKLPTEQGVRRQSYLKKKK